LYRRGGAETYTLALADLLRANGHEVLFFGMKHPENLPCEQERYFVDFIDFPTLNQEKSLRNSWKVLNRSIYYRQARDKLRQLIDDLQPDLVHLQNIHAHLTPSIITEIRRAGLPVVWTLHDFKLICPENSFYSKDRICEECRGGRFYRCAINRCKKESVGASAVAALEAYVHAALGTCRQVDRFISPSMFLKKKFEEYGWVSPRIEFIRNFLPDLGPCRTGGRNYGVYTGMLRLVKGVGTLLDALSQAGDPEFYIAGDGPMRDELENRAKALRLRNTTFLGHLDKPRLTELVDDCGYAVVPSEWYENCPYAVLELMAAGKPVIASNHGGLIELVENEHTGLLFDPKNASQLAKAIRRLADDGETRLHLGSAGRRVAEREFSPTTHYLKLCHVYNELLNSPARSTGHGRSLMSR
jgi:glycosyltransferase involved in cell wall biosynthesis